LAKEVKLLKERLAGATKADQPTTKDKLVIPLVPQNTRIRWIH